MRLRLKGRPTPSAPPPRPVDREREEAELDRLRMVGQDPRDEFLFDQAQRDALDDRERERRPGCFYCGGSGIRCCEFGADKAVGTAAVRGSLLVYADELDRQIMEYGLNGITPPGDLLAEAVAARAAALAAEAR